MSITKEIVDYSEHKSEVDKWIRLKGEQKYLQFAGILKEHDQPVTWQNISELYRYDKRLLINLFKYLSFFEEYLRALVWNASETKYNTLSNSYLNDALDMVIELKDSVACEAGFMDSLIANRDYINGLRNRVSHNKIMLNYVKDGKTLGDMILLFKKTLPFDYQKGFASDINSCTRGLRICKDLIVSI